MDCEINDKVFIQKINELLCLGSEIKDITRVSGGLTHKMYRLDTKEKSYAIKLLNPNIMAREDALRNFTFAEECEEKMKSHGLPIVSSLIFGGKYMQEVDGQYFYVFPWVNGKNVHHGEITEWHCKQMAMTLAQLHNIDWQEGNEKPEEIKIDWDNLLSMAREQKSEIVSSLETHLDMLNDCTKRWNEAERSIPRAKALSHNDMDSKNVLWRDDEFWLIDLESAGYSNPYWEMFDLALCWSGFYESDVDWNLFRTFLQTYRQYANHFYADAHVLFGCDMNRLDWLLFNIKRALMICCNTKEEQRLGIYETTSTIEQMEYYLSIEDKIADVLMHIER